MRQQVNGFAGRGGQRLFLPRRPLGEDVAALLDARAVSKVIAQHDVEARKQNLHEKLVECSDPRACRRGDQQVIVTLPWRMNCEAAPDS